IRAEEKTKQTYRADTGIWIEQLTTATPTATDPNAVIANPIVPTGGSAGPGPTSGMSREQAEMYERRYGLKRGNAEAVPAAPTPGAPGAGGSGSGGTNDVDVMNITFRAIGLSNIQPGANADTALELLNQIRSSPYFDPSTNTSAG